MTSSNSAADNLLVGLAFAGSAQADADNANRRAIDAEARALQAELDAASKTTDRDLERRLDDANTAERIALYNYNLISAQLAEKDAMLTEWMHSNESFKRLARQYAKQLGLNDAQRRQDLDRHIIESAREEPDFANTKFGTGANSRQGKN